MTTTPATPAAPTAVAKKSGHAPIRGVNYYYEIRGTGEPLLLLHGGLGNLDMFEGILPILTASRQVILVDLHGHGRTSLGNRAINVIEQGDDFAALLDHLGYAKVDVAGFSLGANVAFRLAEVARPGRAALTLVWRPRAMTANPQVFRGPLHHEPTNTGSLGIGRPRLGASCDELGRSAYRP